MKQVGKFVREAIEATERGALESAFVSTCAAIDETLKKSLAQTDVSSGDYREFIKRHWRLLTFTGLPRALPLSLKVEFGLTRLVHGFQLRNAEEAVFHIIRQTAVVGHLPAQFKFHQGFAFEMEGDKILVPATLIRGLIGIVIFQPANKGESVPDNYWINISDFKMFVSEFWGRIDLAERIMDFYLS
jgi:hypothetical protein